MTEQKQDKATARPWKVCGGSTPQFMAITSCDGYIVFQFADASYKFENGKPIKAPNYEAQRVNAALIVKAVNEYSALCAIAEAAKYYLDSESTTAECDRRFKEALAALAKLRS